MEYKYAIGIDPGTNTGIAVWDLINKSFIDIKTMGIFSAMKYIENISNQGILLVVENPNTWKPFSKEINISKLQGAGSIKRDYRIWEEFAKELDIKLLPIKLQGHLKKMENNYFKSITGWTKQTTTHSRDASMLVFDFNIEYYKEYVKHLKKIK